MQCLCLKFEIHCEFLYQQKKNNSNSVLSNQTSITEQVTSIVASTESLKRFILYSLSYALNNKMNIRLERRVEVEEEGDRRRIV